MKFVRGYAAIMAILWAIVAFISDDYDIMAAAFVAAIVSLGNDG